MEKEKYMKNIQVSAYVGIALDICVVICAFVFRCLSVVQMSFIEFEESPRSRWIRRIKFIFINIFLGFGLSFIDTLTGKSNTLYCG